jgi:hypothetical protein
LHFAFNWVLMLVAGRSRMDLDSVVLKERGSDVAGIFGGSGVTAYCLDGVPMSMVECDYLF